jgi:hypothetical protein
MIHDFTLVYELGQGMDCRMMFCADWQAASALMLRSAGGGVSLWFSAARLVVARQRRCGFTYRGFAFPLCNGAQSIKLRSKRYDHLDHLNQADHE